MELTENDRRYRLNLILYTVIQLTWGLLQNIGGITLWLILTVINPRRKRGYYHGAILTYWGFSFSMGLGMFIFFGHSKQPEAYAKAVLVHEYGHTIQSCILGPLFSLVIGIPSTVWAFTPIFVKWRKSGRYTYFDFYPESWANYEGERILHESAPGKRLADSSKKA